MPNAECRMSNVECRMSNVECRGRIYNGSKTTGIKSGVVGRESSRAAFWSIDSEAGTRLNLVHQPVSTGLD